MNKNKHTAKLVFLAMMTALGVVISPILRVEGMCPMAHFINVTCAVMLGPWYAFVCALAIGIIRMTCMGIPPLALTGAIFGAFLSGMLYRMSRGRLVWAFAGEVIGTGIIGAILSYPVMTFVWGKTGLTWFFYVPSFIAGTLIGGTIAFLFLKHLQKARLLSMFQETLGSRTYDSGEDVVNDALGIAFSGFIGYLAVTGSCPSACTSGRFCDKQSPLYSSGRLSGSRPDILEHQTAQSSLKRAFSHFHTYIKGGSHHESYLPLA